MKSKMIKTIIFDIGNVLTHFSWLEHFSSFGYSTTVLDKLGKATILSPDWNEYDLGNLSDDDVLELFVQNDPSVEKELRQSLANINGLITRCDYAIPWIHDLKSKGYQVLFLSNFFEKALNECSPAMDFIPHMDGGIFSYRVHMTKPDLDIYKLLLQQYNLISEECVFLDDSPANIETAISLGIHSILFKNLAQARKDLAELGII